MLVSPLYAILLDWKRLLLKWRETVNLPIRDPPDVFVCVVVVVAAAVVVVVVVVIVYSSIILHWG